MFRTVLRVVVLSLVGCVVVVLLAQRRMLFPRPPVPAIAPPETPGVERLLLRPDGVDGEVEAWLLRPTTPVDRPAPVLVFTHGNGELVDHWLPVFGAPRGWGFAVLLVEYPGYGRSGGAPSEDSIVATMLAAHDLLAARADVDVGSLVAWGRSLGAGAACALATRRPVSALVLESAFTSVPAMARTLGVPGFLVRDRFDNVAALGTWDGPTLVLHGERDTIVPVAHGERLAEVAGVPLVRLPCGHNDCARPWNVVREFLAAQGLPP